ncbi:MAG TPA: sigma-70 family RNA polymerase sigma factor [Tepidisphaeraceae bacterium]|jgi:RNA polymerase sigma-70 factor (ECF subfamily)|nr:sigma-70 family RNA polymerase sigma factor [Tepidisphaeraceae bacterium]
MSPHDHLAKLLLDRAGSLKLYARQWLDAASAEDVLQDALTSLLAQRHAPTDPVAWMYRTVRNAAIDHARASARRTRREKTIATNRPEWFTESPDALLDAATAERALRDLPADTREIVILRIWADLNFAQIAEIAGMSLSAAHKKYTAALKQLRTTLETPCPNKTTT